MKAIVDDKIPYIKGQIEQLVDEVVYLKGKDISRDDVKYADILIIRTRTNCNKDLLEGSNVKFIVTATIGFDHIDTKYCEDNNISWTNCPGCNANSVRCYIHNVLAYENMLEEGKTIGIVGVGHVGSLVAKDSKENGLKTLLCDPPLKDEGRELMDEGFIDLKTIEEEADIITFHTPLTKEGKYKTFHMANEDFFKTLKKKPLIINASRGGVVDNIALIKAIDEGLIRGAVIDTWEGEPNINLELLRKVDIATPHVAGYSANGKSNATRMSLEAVAKFLGKDFTPSIVLPEAETLSVATLVDDSNQLKENPDGFEEFRGNYPVRVEGNR